MAKRGVDDGRPARQNPRHRGRTTSRWTIPIVLVMGLLGAMFSATPATAELPDWPLVRSGDQGPQTTTVQYLLGDHGHDLEADGIFGPITESAVRSFQDANDMDVDGIVGSQTWPALVVAVPDEGGGRAVSALQTQLNRHGADLTVDGTFDASTGAALEAFQDEHEDLEPTGIADVDTWQALVGGSPSASGDYALVLDHDAMPRSAYEAPHHTYPAIDLPTATGTTTYAVTNGTVSIIDDTQCGRGVSLSGDDGAQYNYCHLSDWSVSGGARVEAGQQVGLTGNTGHSTGPHLHLQIRAGGVLRCPQSMMLALYDGDRPPAPDQLPTTGCFY